MATTRDLDPHDLAADLAHARALLAARGERIDELQDELVAVALNAERLAAERDGLVGDLAQIHGDAGAADPVRALVEHLKRYGAELEREVADVKAAAKGEVDRLTMLLGQAAEARDAAHAAGLADARQLVDDAKREAQSAVVDRDKAWAQIGALTTQTQRLRAALDERTRERDEALARRGQPVEADAHEELGVLKLQIAELRAAMRVSGVSVGSRPTDVLTKAADLADQMGELETKVKALEDVEDTPEHTLGVALLEWLDGESTFGDLRGLVNACADGPTIDDHSTNVDEPGLSPTALMQRRCWVLLSEVVKDGAWTARDEAARRIAELEVDADAELRRLAEAQRAALLDISEHVARAFWAEGDSPRPSVAMRNRWANALRQIDKAAKQTIEAPPESRLAKLRARDRALAVLLDRLAKIVEDAEYEGDDDEKIECREYARVTVRRLFARSYDDCAAEGDVIEALFATRHASVWGEEPAPTEEDAKIAHWALASYKGDASFMVHGTPRLTGCAGNLWEGLRAHFVAQPFLREIGAALARLRGDPSVSIESQQHARELYGERFLRAMYAAHDDGALPFGDVAAVDAWVADHASPHMTRGSALTDDAVLGIDRDLRDRADRLAWALGRVAALATRHDLERAVQDYRHGGAHDPTEAVVAVFEPSTVRAALVDGADPGDLVAVLRGIAERVWRPDLVKALDAWRVSMVDGRDESSPAHDILAAAEVALGHPVPTSEHGHLEEALRVIARVVERPELAEDGLAPQAIVGAVQAMRARLWGDLPVHVEALRVVAEVFGRKDLAAALVNASESARAAIEVSSMVEDRGARGAVPHNPDDHGSMPHDDEPSAPAPAETIVATSDYCGVSVDLLKRGRQVLWRVRGVTPDSGGAPVELGRAVAPLARKEANAAARRWISEHLQRQAPPE